MSRPRQPCQLEEAKPLVSQLKRIHEKITNNSAAGDLSSPFPSLIGQEEYLPLFQTLIKYTGCQIDDIDYDTSDFGEKVYSELLNFGIFTLDEIFCVIEKLHIAQSNANLQEWVEMFTEKFEALNGINDLNGEDFDRMIIQLILLHFCPRLDAAEVEVNPSVRDMIGYPSLHGFDTVEENISRHSVASSPNAKNQTTLDVSCSEESNPGLTTTIPLVHQPEPAVLRSDAFISKSDADESFQIPDFDNEMCKSQPGKA